MTTTREIQLASRPTGWPVPENFRMVETELPEPADGQALVRNLVMSVDPYMRGRMNDVRSYVPPFQLDRPLDGAAVGEVLSSRAAGLVAGDLVLHDFGWREHAVADAPSLRKVTVPDGLDASVFLGPLGAIGLTAYVGLLDIGGFREGDTVFVSGAAGAVGSLVGQFARLRGAKRVIGSAGSADKVRHLTDELGFHAAVNYRDGNLREQLAAAAPDGIDLYFDNVGGDHLEAAISVLNQHGRIAACGAISQYNSTEPVPAPRNLAMVVTKRLTMRGFIVIDHRDRMRDLLAEVGPWLADGSVRFAETRVAGLANAPQAFLDMMHGANTGKMLVQLAD